MSVEKEGKIEVFNKQVKVTEGGEVEGREVSEVRVNQGIGCRSSDETGGAGK